MDYDTPAVINIYAKTFEDKEAIAELISQYNDSVSEEDRITYTDYVAILMSSITDIISGISYLLQLTGAAQLPATVLYPMVTGGSIIFSALSGRVFFREKLSVYQLVSIGLCLVGTLLFL